MIDHIVELVEKKAEELDAERGELRLSSFEFSIENPTDRNFASEIHRAYGRGYL